MTTLDLTSPCIEWRGSRDRQGYGKKNGRMAHRVIWEREVGPIPDGLELDHLCWNKPCVNVLHLEPITRAVHALRRREATSATCAKGHAFDAANTYWRPRRGNGGWRGCRACNREAVARYSARQAAST